MLCTEWLSDSTSEWVICRDSAAAAGNPPPRCDRVKTVRTPIWFITPLTGYFIDKGKYRWVSDAVYGFIDSIAFSLG